MPFFIDWDRPTRKRAQPRPLGGGVVACPTPGERVESAAGAVVVGRGIGCYRKARLEAKGWRVGSAEELLGMTSDEAAYVDLRLKFSGAVRDFRKKKRLTQIELAELLHQSRVAKVEAADESVSLDLLIRSLLALGATDQDLAKEIGGKGSRVP